MKIPTFEELAGNKELSTIKLHKPTMEILNKFKIHRRETYEELLLRMLKVYFRYLQKKQLKEK